MQRWYNIGCARHKYSSWNCYEVSEIWVNSTTTMTSLRTPVPNFRAMGFVHWVRKYTPNHNFPFLFSLKAILPAMFLTRTTHENFTIDNQLTTPQFPLHPAPLNLLFLSPAATHSSHSYHNHLLALFHSLHHYPIRHQVLPHLVPSQNRTRT